MATQSPITVPDVALQDTWNCVQNSNGTYSAKNITTVTETRTVTVSGIPAGATNITGYQSVTVGSPYSGANIRRINGYTVSTNETQTVPIDISGNGSVSILFEFRPYGHTQSHVASHTSTLNFTNMVLIVSYTEPQTSFDTDFGTSISAGSSLQLTLNSSSSSYSHRVTVRFGAYEYVEQLNPGVTTFSYVIPYTWLYAIPDSTSGVGTIYVESLSGSSVMGTSTQAFTLTCPYDVRPIPGQLYFTVNNQMWDMVLQKYSSASVSVIGAEGSYGSTIRSYLFTCNGITSGSSTGYYNTGVFTSSGSVPITVTVVDSRGRQATISSSIYVNPYQEPEISAVYAERCNAENVGSSMGTAAHILIGCGYSAIGENSITTTVEYKESTSSEWSSPISVTPSTTTYYQFANEGTFDSSSSYDIRVIVTDSLGKSAISIQTLGTAYAFMQWEPQTNAIGFGCHPQGPNRIEINSDWDLYVNGKKFGDTTTDGDTVINGNCQITGDLWMKNDTAYGNSIHFGDKDLSGNGMAFIGERSDDSLTIYGRANVYLNSGYGSVYINGNLVPSFAQASEQTTGVYLPIYENGVWKLISKQEFWNYFGDG